MDNNTSYNFVFNDGVLSSIIYTTPNGVFTAIGAHARADAIVEAIKSGRPHTEVEAMFSPEEAIRKSFDEGDIKIENGAFYYKDALLENPLSDAIIRAYEDGAEDFSRLILFFEKINNNPSPNSRKHLYLWLDNQSFSINERGNIIGYKALTPTMTSIHSGPAYVNGSPFNGHVPNAIGNVISMNRADVTFDPNQTCSHGLHVGTFEYANMFGGRSGVVVMVEVDPADVVSVPADHGNQKMRVCSYKVLEVAPKQPTTIFVNSIDFDYNEHDTW